MRVRLVLWLLFVAAFVLLYWTRSATWGSEFREVATLSLLLGYALYLALGCVRGFTLIPAANLVLLAIPIFPPLPLLVLTRTPGARSDEENLPTHCFNQRPDNKCKTATTNSTSSLATHGATSVFGQKCRSRRSRLSAAPA